MKHWRQIVLGEVLGTFTLVFFGCGIIAIDLLTGAGLEAWKIGLVWGAALALGISLAAGLSGAHLNPAITLAMAIWRRQADFKIVLVYMLSQFAGAIMAAILLYTVLSGAIGNFETAHGLTRGKPGSELSAMMFGQYSPDPALTNQAKKAGAGTSTEVALLAEFIGTTFLALVVFAVSARPRVPAEKWAGRSKLENRASRNSGTLAPVVIGATLATVISIAPVTQAGLNPARDFGPRLVSYFGGWGAMAIPGPTGSFWIYVVGPVLGALLGGALFERFFHSAGGPRSI